MSRTTIFVCDLLCLIGFMLMIFASAFGAKIGLEIGVQWYVIAAFWLGFGHHHFGRKAHEERWGRTNRSSTLTELDELRKQYEQERRDHGPR